MSRSWDCDQLESWQESSLKFVDPSPPSSPSVEEQTDALQKGLGRTMQWATTGKLEDKPLIKACLHDLRHDMQVEDSRGSWLWQLIQAVNGEQRFRNQLVEELRELPDARSIYQLCELAYCYAAQGDDEFRKRLYEIVEQKPVPDSPGLGEDEILRLDGQDAFVFAAKVRGTRLASREWEWHDASLIHDATEQLGETQVGKLLKSTTDKSVKRFHDCWLAEKKRDSERKPQPSRKEQMQETSVDEIIAEAESQRPGIGFFRGWGMHASDDDLNTVLQGLWSVDHPKVILNFLRVFSNRPLPTFDPRMIEFCNHSDEQVRLWAFNALQMNSHPLVREFAVTNIRQGLRDRFFGGLLIRNYAAGDENLLLEALELPEDVNELHWLLMDVIKVLENNEEADPSKLALVVYAQPGDRKRSSGQMVGPVSGLFQICDGGMGNRSGLGPCMVTLRFTHSNCCPTDSCRSLVRRSRSNWPHVCRSRTRSLFLQPAPTRSGTQLG